MKYFFPLLAILVLAIACAPSVYDQSFNKQENLTWREFPQTKEVVFDVVLKQLQMGTATLLVIDPELGIITTDWREETSLRQQIITGGQRNRLNYNIISAPNNSGITVVKINMSVQQRGEGIDRDSWQEQPVTSRVARNIIRPLLEQIEDDLRSNFPY